MLQISMRFASSLSSNHLIQARSFLMYSIICSLFPCTANRGARGISNSAYVCKSNYQRISSHGMVKSDALLPTAVAYILAVGLGGIIFIYTFVRKLGQAISLQQRAQDKYRCPYGEIKQAALGGIIVSRETCFDVFEILCVFYWLNSLFLPAHGLLSSLLLNQRDDMPEIKRVCRE